MIETILNTTKIDKKSTQCWPMHYNSTELSLNFAGIHTIKKFTARHRRLLKKPKTQRT